MKNERLVIGGLVLLLALTGATLFLTSQDFFFAPAGQEDEEERPPIIVENGGSVTVGPRYPTLDGKWGAWEYKGPLNWHYTLPSVPAKEMRTIALNGQCSPNLFPMQGALEVTYTDGSMRSFTLQLTANKIILKTKQGEPGPTQAAATPWLLTFGVGDGVSLAGLSYIGGPGAGSCTFTPTGKPVIVIEQLR